MPSRVGDFIAVTTVVGVSGQPHEDSEMAETICSSTSVINGHFDGSLLIRKNFDWLSAMLSRNVGLKIAVYLAYECTWILTDGFVEQDGMEKCPCYKRRGSAAHIVGLQARIFGVTLDDLLMTQADKPTGTRRRPRAREERGGRSA